MRSTDLTVDVTEAAGLGEPLHQTVTVHAPDGALPTTPVVCFAYPGGGFSRGYWSFDMPDSSGGGEAGFHTERGWVVVEVDHLGVGGSSSPADPFALTYENIAAANHVVVDEVLRLLASGAVDPSLPAVADPVVIGLGQSMGGIFLTVLQANHGGFDGIGVLGSSAIHTIVPVPPGNPPLGLPWIPRSSPMSNPVILNAAALAHSVPLMPEEGRPAPAVSPMQWAFHFDDEPAEVVARDMNSPIDDLPPWRSATVPLCAGYGTSPGMVAGEAAAIAVPVLIGVGERDVVPEPHREPAAYKSATDITLVVCPGNGAHAQLRAHPAPVLGSHPRVGRHRGGAPGALTRAAPPAANRGAGVRGRQ